AEMIAYYESLVADYPLAALEDPPSAAEWDSWAELVSKACEKVQILGDDLCVPNPERLAKRIQHASANSLLVKLQPVGTMPAALAAATMAQRAGSTAMASHRSGETEDTTIADLSVAVNAGQIKTGAPARGERINKYNQLLRIEDELDQAARYAGSAAFPRYKG